MEQYPEYLVAFFDVLGFKNKLLNQGLETIHQKYLKLIDVIDKKNAEQDKYREIGFQGAFWVVVDDEPPHPVVMHDIRGAYASDSILIWSNKKVIGGPVGVNIGSGPVSLITPDVWADTFLEVCCEVICHSIEIGLPLRGGISTGKSVLDGEKNIYLGKPLIHASKAESRHNYLGVSFCRGANLNVKKSWLIIPYTEHMKDGSAGLVSGEVLNWPEHWRRTRNESLADSINALNSSKDSERYYENTIQFIDASLRYEHKNVIENDWLIFPGVHAKSLMLKVLRPALFKRNRPDLFQERQKLVPRHQRGIYGP
uniref:Guanylate cyclase domain-containing protein n=1 Tax=Candidatus Kentrum sp. DK TaxID=2126562 RepID=A0A450T5M0_9GAMM|nr:MAG: hypothetical protein BECKDK2373B_GA0170837_110521 [Candidatus Kentron sp. DK]